MKSSIVHLLISITGLLALSGCYTSFKTVTPEESESINGMGEATPVDDGWFETSGPYFYVDYNARGWYGYHGIDLAGDTTSSGMANYRHQNLTRSYWFSPFSDSFFSVPSEIAKYPIHSSTFSWGFWIDSRTTHI